MISQVHFFYLVQVSDRAAEVLAERDHNGRRYTMSDAIDIAFGTTPVPAEVDAASDPTEPERSYVKINAARIYRRNAKAA